MKNRIYEEAKLEIVMINDRDLITTSGTIGKDDSSNDAEWID